jgi:hypothetical protein
MLRKLATTGEFLKPQILIYIFVKSMQKVFILKFCYGFKTVFTELSPLIGADVNCFCVCMWKAFLFN